jgi:hypothetical protein
MTGAGADSSIPEPHNQSKILWQRPHVNGWRAVVTRVTPGNFEYGIWEEGRPEPAFRWGGTARSLARAMRLADRLVPWHSCSCGDWVAFA